MTTKDIRPYYMDKYLGYNGPHFNKQLLEFAVSRMYKIDEAGNRKHIKPLLKEDVDNILKSNNVHLKNKDVLWDYVYVANMVKADFYGDSIEDELHMAKYIKNVIDDPDGYDGIVFNRWYADMCKKGIPIDWASMI